MQELSKEEALQLKGELEGSSKAGQVESCKKTYTITPDMIVSIKLEQKKESGR